MMGRKKTHKEYLQELIDKNIKYLPLEHYKGSLDKILHNCPTCSNNWKITPSYVLTGRGKCPNCFDNFKRKKTTSEYKQELASKGILHKCIAEYKTARIPILHICSNGHEWLVRPENILRGDGCPSCTSYGFDPTKHAILYYIKISKGYNHYYKVGISNNSIDKRFLQERDKVIKVLMQKEFIQGSDARSEEKRILSNYKDKRVNVPNFLKSGGNTELFEIDILGLDT